MCKYNNKQSVQSEIYANSNTKIQYTALTDAMVSMETDKVRIWM